MLSSLVACGQWCGDKEREPIQLTARGLELNMIWKQLLWIQSDTGEKEMSLGLIQTEIRYIETAVIVLRCIGGVSGILYLLSKF